LNSTLALQDIDLWGLGVVVKAEDRRLRKQSAVWRINFTLMQRQPEKWW